MHGVVTRTAALLFLAIVVSSCGGGGASSPASPGPTPTPLGAPAPVVLDSGNFDRLVLGAAGPCLVEFHLPT